MLTVSHVAPNVKRATTIPAWLQEGTLDVVGGHLMPGFFASLEKPVLASEPAPAPSFDGAGVSSFEGCHYCGSSPLPGSSYCSTRCSKLYDALSASAVLRAETPDSEFLAAMEGF